MKRLRKEGKSSELRTHSRDVLVGKCPSRVPHRSRRHLDCYMTLKVRRLSGGAQASYLPFSRT